MTIDYSGNGYTSPDFLTGPSPGELVGASSIGVPLQQAINLLDTKANLTGADFTGAVTATNTTADPGIEATGGAGAAGGSFIGGTGGAPGVVAVGTTNTAGVTGTGNGTGAGVTGTGGATGTGVTGTGGSTGTGGKGGTFTAGGTASNGVEATGAGSGAGLVATGGATGKGIVCDGGATSGVAADIGTGGAQFTGTSPAATADPGANNMLFAANVVKAWGRLHTDGAGVGSAAVVIDDAYNLVSAVVVASPGNRVTVTFARAMANDDYAVVVSSSQFGGPHWAITDNQSTTAFDIRWIDAAGGSVDPDSVTVVSASFIVLGRQA